MCGERYVEWLWTGPWLVTCRLEEGHSGEHSYVTDKP